MPSDRPWEDDPIVEEQDAGGFSAALRQRGMEDSVARAFAGAQARGRYGENFNALGLDPALMDMDERTRAEAIGAGTMEGTREAGPLAAGAAALPLAAAAAPFLATPAGGAVTGAIPGLRQGDLWQAAKGAALGAATGGVGGKLLPFLLRLRAAAPAAVAATEAAAPAVAETGAVLTPDIANRLRQIAQTSAANKALVKKITEEMGEEGAALWEAIKAARTRI